MIAQAVEAGFQELLAEYAGLWGEDSKAIVVRNDCLPERKLPTGLGPVTVKIQKVCSKSGKSVTFRSALVRPVSACT